MTSARALRILAAATGALLLFLLLLAYAHSRAQAAVAVGAAADSGALSPGIWIRLLAEVRAIFVIQLLALSSFGGLALGLMRAAFRTERREAARVREHTTLALEGVLHNSTEAIALKNLDGEYLAVSRRFADLFRVAQSDVPGMTDYQLFSKVVADAIRESDRRAISDGQVLEVEEILPNDAVPHTFLSRKQLLRDGTGHPFALCVVSREAAVERDAVEEHVLGTDMYQAQKLEAIGTLAGGLAHDFNNVLTAVLGGLEMALKGVSTDDTRLRRRLLRVQKAARRAAALTRQLLTLSRPTQAVKGLTDVNTVVKAATQLLQRSIPENIEVRTWLGEGLPLVLADAGQVEQALLNLGVNARDAMPNGGRITFETAAVTVDEEHALAQPDAQTGVFVRLSVTDTGTGIPKRLLARIFEPFFTTKEVGKGTGLGLAMVNACAKVHEGWLDVSSVVGRGTTFTLYLPESTVVSSQVVLPLGGAVEGADPEDPVAMHGGKETILVVDDEPDVRDLVEAGLGQFGYRILLAEDGEHAVAVLSQHASEIRLILTDLVMPKCGGDKLLRIVRSRGFTMPVVLMSGYVPPSAGDVFTDADFAAIVNKPFTPQELALTIRRTLDSSPHAAAPE